MADYVSVANLALGKIGEVYRISDPAEDSHPARTIAGPWAMVRRAMLRKGKFNVAMTRAELAAQAATDPNYRLPFPYTNRFPLPADCLRLVEVFDSSGRLFEDYRSESKALIANSAGPLYVRYARDLPDVGDWDDIFVEAFAARLGFEIADPLSGDRGRKADCWKEYLHSIGEAGGVDAKEDPPEDAYDSSWVSARFGGAIGGPGNV